MGEGTWDQGIELKPWTRQRLVEVDGSPLEVYDHATVDLSLIRKGYFDHLWSSQLHTANHWLSAHKLTICPGGN